MDSVGGTGSPGKKCKGVDISMSSDDDKVRTTMLKGIRFLLAHARKGDAQNGKGLLSPEGHILSKALAASMTRYPAAKPTAKGVGNP